NNVYGSSEEAVRESVRDAILDHFHPSAWSSHDANRFFEKWIDVRKFSYIPLKAPNGTRFYQFTVYLYLTMTKYVLPIVELVQNEKIKSVFYAPKRITVAGHHVQQLKCQK